MEKKIKEFTIKDSIFYVKESNKLKKVLFVDLEVEKEIFEMEITLTNEKNKISKKFPKIESGKTRLEIYVPEVNEPTKYDVLLSYETEELKSNVIVNPERHWKIFIIHHSHLDIGYTDPQPEVLDYHLKYLDQALELCDLQNSNSEDDFKWVIEVTWPLKYWLKSRPKLQIERMIKRIKEGRIEVCGAYINMHTEAYDIDELAGTFELTQRLRDEFGIKIDVAMQSDVPGHTKGFLKCLTDMGIKYLSVAHNYAGRSIPYLLPGKKLERPFYWELENGKKVLVWYTDTPHGVYMEGNNIGIDKSYEEVYEKLPELLQQLKNENYRFNAVHLRVQGRGWDNAGPSITPSEVAKKWNEKWEYPKLIISTNKQFFEYIEGQDTQDIPVFKGDWTDWWSDGIASNAYAMGLNRTTHNILRAAETLLSIIEMNYKDQTYPKEILDSARENMVLFDEHTWGAWNPWENSLTHNTSGEIQWSIKKSFAQNAYNESLFEYRKALHLLPILVDNKVVSENSTILVYNPSSFVRTDIVKAFIPLGKCDVRKPFKIVDENGEEIKFNIRLQTGEIPRPLGAEVTFVAKDVPATGIKSYSILLKKEENESLKEISKEGEKYILENSFYKISFDQESGTIKSIIDKELGEELVNQNSFFQFNEYIYDQFTTAPRFNHLSSRIEGKAETLLGHRYSSNKTITLRKDKLNFEFGDRHPEILSKIKILKDNQIYQKAIVTLHVPGCEWIEQEIVLYNEIKRIDFVNRLKKIETETKEAAYFAFPFNVENGKIRYEITGEDISLEDEFVPGSCHYMKAIQNWLSVSNSKYTIIWGTKEAPLIQLKNIYIPYNPFEPTLKSDEPTTVYSYALNNIWDTNFPNKQGGEIEFHYSITSYQGSFDPIKAYRFGTQIQNPLSGVTFPYEMIKKNVSFVSVEPENVLILAARKVKENRFQIRLQEISGKNSNGTLRIPNIKIKNAYVANIGNGELKPVENKVDEITFSIEKNSILTLIFDI